MVARLREAHPYVRRALASAVPGRALELGCGLGATAIWLASYDGTVTAVDVSRVALDAAAEHAERAGVSSRITWQHAELREWATQERFDLVAALFLHTPLELDAPALLARAEAQTRVGGALLSVGHDTLPPWNPHDTDGLLSAGEVAAALGVQEPEWQIVVAESCRASRRATTAGTAPCWTRCSTPCDRPNGCGRRSGRTPPGARRRPRWRSRRIGRTSAPANRRR